MMPEKTVIQFVECSNDTGLDDWPDCQEGCEVKSCPVKKRISEDVANGIDSVLRYTIWPD